MTGVTAGHIAVAIVAACAVTGGRPEAVFEQARGNKRTRALAAAACMRVAGLTPKAVAGSFRVERNRLAPSMLRHDGTTDAEILTVMEALRAAGLGGGDAEEASPPPRAPAATDVPALKPKPASVSPRPDGPVIPAPDPIRRPRPHDPPVRPARLTTNPVRATAGRVKAVTANMVRWSRQQMRLGVAVAVMADLFDVPAEDLAEAVGTGPQMARAA